MRLYYIRRACHDFFSLELPSFYHHSFVPSSLLLPSLSPFLLSPSLSSFFFHLLLSLLTSFSFLLSFTLFPFLPSPFSFPHSFPSFLYLLSLHLSFPFFHSRHICIIEFSLYPSCLQTTAASLASQRSSHTVPYVLL